QLEGEPRRIAENGEREHEMRGEAVVADAGSVHEPAHHYQPAHQALRSAQAEQRECTSAQRWRQSPLQPEPDEWDQEHDTDQARHQAVHVLPEEDELELGERHPGAPRLVLRVLLVELERLQPLRFTERRYEDRKSTRLNSS